MDSEKKGFRKQGFRKNGFRKKWIPIPKKWTPKKMESKTTDSDDSWIPKNGFRKNVFWGKTDNNQTTPWGTLMWSFDFSYWQVGCNW